jgi:thiol-disulfide isomerase/thioredoxin
MGNHLPTPLTNGKEDLPKNKYVFIDFTMNGCGPCKKIKPTFDELAQTYGTRRDSKNDICFVSANISGNKKNETLLQEYWKSEEDVSVPFFVLINNAKDTFTTIQTTNPDTLKNWLKSQLLVTGFRKK